MTAHLANTGSMKTLLDKGSMAYLLYDPSPKRKLDYRVMSIETPHGVRVGVNTALTNALVEEALQNKILAPFQDATHWKRESVFTAGTRFDFELFFDGKPSCYLEVKNVQMSRKQGIAEFPDAVTTRGAKHWHELTEALKKGHRAALCFCIQRNDEITEFRLATDIDPDYALAARRAIDAGVEVYAYQCRVNPDEITVTCPVPVII